MTPKQWEALAKQRAGRLARLMELDAPDVLIGAAWHLTWMAVAKVPETSVGLHERWRLIWNSMVAAYGIEVFEQAQEAHDRIHHAINNSN